MNDICIKLLSKHPAWTNYYDVDIDMYKNWIKDNMPSDTFYIPRGKEPLVFFLDRQDLVLFTLQFGRDCYEIMGDVIDMSKIERMIWNEVVQERLHEKSNN
jgi:hypothetical protein